jgi:hypothetical protein
VKILEEIFVLRKSGSYKNVIEIQAKLLPLMIATNSFIEDVKQLMETMKSIIFPTSCHFNVEKHDDCPYFQVLDYLKFISSNE